jgi:hypothetical protein
MSAMGQKQTLGKVQLMSALLPKADIGTCHEMSALCHAQSLEGSFCVRHECQLNVPIQPAMACPISRGESSWMK